MALNGGLKIRLTTCYIHIASSIRIIRLTVKFWLTKISAEISSSVGWRYSLIISAGSAMFRPDPRFRSSSRISSRSVSAFTSPRWWLKLGIVSSGKWSEEAWDVEEELENERERKDDRDTSSQLLALELEHTRYGSKEWGGLTGGSPFILKALSNLHKTWYH